MKFDETLEFPAEAIAETELAVLCVIDGVKHWVPKSQIVDESDIQADGDMGDLIVKAWWAEAEGLA